MIDIFYDTEFIENGATIDLISIGMVSSKGDEYYAVNQYIQTGDLYLKICIHPWLMANVVPHLPTSYFEPTSQGVLRNRGYFALNDDDPAIKPHWLIAGEVREFLLQYNEPIRLWAYYGAYDHVVLSQLWGVMMNRPDGIPMFTHDLMQFASFLGIDDSSFPKQVGTVHNALEDAKWNKIVFQYLLDLVQG